LRLVLNVPLLNRCVVSGFALVTKRQDEDDVGRLEIPIQRDIAGLAARDYQLVQAVLRGPTDQRMPRQHGNQLFYRGDHHCSERGIVGSEEIEDPLKITYGSLRVGDYRQVLAFGRAGCLPDTFASM